MLNVKFKNVYSVGLLPKGVNIYFNYKRKVQNCLSSTTKENFYYSFSHILTDKLIGLPSLIRISSLYLNFLLSRIFYSIEKV